MSVKDDLIQPDRGQSAHRISLVDPHGFDAWSAAASEMQRSLARAADFTGKDGQLLILPGDQPDSIAVVIGVKDADALDPSLCFLDGAIHPR